MSFPQTLVIPNLYVGLGAAEMVMKSHFCLWAFVKQIWHESLYLLIWDFFGILR